jgi:DNA-binding MarR family transcriptional regulator
MNTQQSKNDDVFADFVAAVFRLNAALLAAGDALVRPVGQTSARWRVLGCISKRPQTVAQIARGIGHARQSVQRVSDVLVRAGLARYIDKPGDKRAQLLTLTARGETVLGQIQQRQQVWSVRLLQILKPEHLAKLTASLDDISQTIAEDYRRTH